MTSAAWNRQHLLTATPPATPPELLALFDEYHRRTEAYDRTVCTGPITRDGIQPMNSRELGLINRHALDVLRELKQRAAWLGIIGPEWTAAFRAYNRNHRG